MKKQFPGLNGYRLIAGRVTRSWTFFLVLCMLVVPGISSGNKDRYVQEPKVYVVADTQVEDIEHADSGTPKAVDLTQKIKELYSQLKQAYESKSTSGVTRCLSSQWGSSDGGSVSDLQRNLQKIFTMFDEVRFNIQNLQVNKVNEGKYKVSYDVTITSKIYKKNLKHEEKSSINEEVTIDQSGQPKISRTLGSKLLSVK